MPEKIKAGSIIYHKPTKKKYLVLGVNTHSGEACIAAWPETIVALDDCEFVEQQQLRKDQIDFRNNTFGNRFK
jgi:hypothetical protein